MSEQQREAVAQAIYAAYVTWHLNRYGAKHPFWNDLDILTRELYRRLADAAYSAIIAL